MVLHFRSKLEIYRERAIATPEAPIAAFEAPVTSAEAPADAPKVA